MRQSVRDEDVHAVRENENVQVLYDSVRVTRANGARVPKN